MWLEDVCFCPMGEMELLAMKFPRIKQLQPETFSVCSCPYESVLGHLLLLPLERLQLLEMKFQPRKVVGPCPTVLPLWLRIECDSVF